MEPNASGVEQPEIVLDGIDGANSQLENAGDGLGGADGGTDDAPVKRGRGRPRKIDAPGNPAAGLAGSTDAGSASAGNGNGKPARGRPRKESQTVSAGVDILAGKIYGLHLVIAMAMKQPHIAIDMEEAKALADACLLVSKEYGVKLSGKTAVSLNLLFTAGVIYIPKALAIYATKGSAPAAPVQNVAAPDMGNIVAPNWGQMQ